jgi:hypothetical protein
MSTHPRLDVPDWDVVVEGRKGGGKGSGGVTVNEHRVIRTRFHYGADATERTAGHLRERLTVLHDVQVKIRNDSEQIQNFIEKLPMLRGNGNSRLKTRVLLQCQDDRCHLDGFRPSAEDYENATRNLRAPYPYTPVLTP